MLAGEIVANGRAVVPAIPFVEAKEPDSAAVFTQRHRAQDHLVCRETLVHPLDQCIRLRKIGQRRVVIALRIGVAAEGVKVSSIFRNESAQDETVGVQHWKCSEIKNGWSCPSDSPIMSIGSLLSGVQPRIFPDLCTVGLFWLKSLRARRNRPVGAARLFLRLWGG